ncbi:low temperature requirement protein A [Streptococcus marmotae]|uniref:low temperature requirement protein A n=1 Tax=Streptococcus marmotae TaxID=1825069 RepID=UPI000835E084|nr:low temperature requirement protein A [Streptococcus marmotae]
MSLIRHKKVELTELFYDLVYVYAISQMTHLLSHVRNGRFLLENVIVFSIALIIFINSWMIQMVFTNRFGKNSLTNTVFMLLQMICLLVAAGLLSNDFQSMVIPFFSTMAVLTGLLLAQYGLEYRITRNTADQYFIKQFFSILGVRILSLLSCLFLPYSSSLVIAVLGIIVTWLMPSFLLNPAKTGALKELTPISFPHLVERLSLLVIITFGEMIIGIAPYFSIDKLSLSSFFPFLIVANLFLFYITEMDHRIAVNKTNVSGNGAIYYHYFIFFGLSFITAAFTLLQEHQLSNDAIVCLLYSGIFLFLVGILLHAPYNKADFSWTPKFYLAELALLTIGFLLSLLVAENSLMFTLVTFFVTVGMTSLMMRQR